MGRDLATNGGERVIPDTFDVTVTLPLTPVTLNEAVSVSAAARAAEIRKHAANDRKNQDLMEDMCLPNH